MTDARTVLRPRKSLEGSGLLICSQRKDAGVSKSSKRIYHLVVVMAEVVVVVVMVCVIKAIILLTYKER